MMQNHVQSALKAAGLFDDLRLIFTSMPALEKPTLALIDYMTLLPTGTRPGGGRPEPIALSCVRSAIDAARASDGKFYGSLDEMHRYIRGLFEPFPALLKVSICYVDPDGENSVCWVPFAESVAEFVARYPSAEQIDEAAPMAAASSDQRIRLLGAARILEFNWAEALVGEPA